MAMDTCRGAQCGARIRWIKTPTGKAMPCDPELETVYLVRKEDEDLAQGAVLGPRTTLVTPEGETVTGKRGTVLVPGAARVEGYVSHWSTCPAQAQFRARRMP